MDKSRKQIIELAEEQGFHDFNAGYVINYNSPFIKDSKEDKAWHQGFNKAEDAYNKMVEGFNEDY